MRQKRQAILIVFSIVLLLFIAGCGRGGDEISGDSPFLGGTRGLELGFLEDSPPDEITDVDFPFQVIVSLKNVGEHDIIKNQVRVDLSGILPTDFGKNSGDITNVPPEDDPSSRKKDSEGNVIEAVETFATIPKNDNFFQLGSDKIRGNTKFTFKADVCYQYQTDVIASLCVLENMISVADDAICNPKGSRPFSSSGSPVKVTAFRQSIAGQNKIQFSFDISHSGTGSVFEHKAITATEGCPKNRGNRRTEENKVKVTVKTGILNTLTCVGVGTGTGEVTDIVRLVNDKRTITCTQVVPQSDFERNVDIKLEFDYSDSVDKKVLAKHLESGSIFDFTANPTTITSGQNAILSWSTTNADSCTASGGWSGSRTTMTGAEVVTPTSTTTYTLACTGPSGIQSKTITVGVGGGGSSGSGQAIALTANPTTITSGQNAILSWSTTNADSCTASSNPTRTDWNGAKAISGFQSVSVPTTTTYSLTCTGPSGTLSQSAIVNVGSGTGTTGTILIDGGAASTTTPSVTLTLSCTDPGGACTQMQIANTPAGVSTATVRTYATSLAWPLSTVDGTKTVYVRYRRGDNAWSDIFLDSITLNAGGAITGTILINAGDASTTTSVATLTLSCTDPGGACTQMRIANTQAGVSTATAQTYATSFNWQMIPGDGTKTVYVRYRRGDNAWSDIFLDSILNVGGAGLPLGEICGTVTPDPNKGCNVPEDDANCASGICGFTYNPEKCICLGSE